MAKDTEKQQTEGKAVQQAAPARALSPFEEMDRMFESVFPRGWMRPFRWGWPAWAESMPSMEMKVPSVDVIDREDAVVVRAEVPGVEKKDLDVTMTDTAVTIKGSSKREQKEEKGDYYRCEISRGSFARTIPLPCAVDGAKTKATFKDGVLELTIPKLEKAKRHSIKVD